MDEGVSWRRSQVVGAAGVGRQSVNVSSPVGSMNTQLGALALQSRPRLYLHSPATYLT